MKITKLIGVTGVLVMSLQVPLIQAADNVILRFGHIWPAVSGPHKQLVQVWADTVEKESGGKITVEVYPSATLAKPPAQYEAVKSRIMDATTTVLGYSANRFPLTQIAEIPGLTKSAIHGSCIVQGLFDERLLDDEFKDTKPLFFFTHGQGLLHLKGHQVKVPEDLAGLRIRRPTTLVAQILENLAALPVGMPAPDSYQSISRGVIDGVAFPWEAALSFRLNELTDTHTEIGGLYNLVFATTMNKEVYDNLSDELKRVIDNNSGMKWAHKAGVLFDKLDTAGRQQALDAGHEIIVVKGGVENPSWKPSLTQATNSYIDSLEDKGLPAAKIRDRAIELAQLCSES